MTLIGKSYFEANSMRGMELSASKRFASSIRSYTTYSCGDAQYFCETSSQNAVGSSGPGWPGLWRAAGCGGVGEYDRSRTAGDWVEGLPGQCPAQTQTSKHRRNEAAENLQHLLIASFPTPAAA
jgi:hypothetical protein